MDVVSVYGSYYETAKSYMGLRKEEKQAGFAEKVTDKSQVSPEDMTLEEYKAYFNEKMNSLYTHPSQRNRNDIIDITDAAYKRMQTDPEYEKKILDALAKNKAVNFGNAGADEGISAGGVGRKDCKAGIGEEQADKGMEQ